MPAGQAGIHVTISVGPRASAHGADENDVPVPSNVLAFDLDSLLGTLHVCLRFPVRLGEHPKRIGRLTIRVADHAAGTQIEFGTVQRRRFEADRIALHRAGDVLDRKSVV